MSRSISPRCSSWFVSRTSFFLLFPLSVLWYIEISTNLPRFASSNFNRSAGRNHSASSQSSVGSERHDTPTHTDVSIRLKSILETHPECVGKERVAEILLKAGKTEILKEECELLPTWEEVGSLYGEEPIIYGLETCQRYREALRTAGRNGTEVEPDPRIAGLFNTGTNAFAESLHLNFRQVKTLTRTEYNLDGGKHTNLKYRSWAGRIDDYGVDSRKKKVFTELPVVLIRDPFRWMGSMCKAPYIATWQRGAFERCPNLTPSPYELHSINKTSNPFEVRLDRIDYIERYDSLGDMWSDWYTRFLNARFPRLIIRYEDTLFHAEKVFGLVMECIGRPASHPYAYQLEASKVHGSSSDFVHALAKYGTERGRYAGLLPNDRVYAKTALNAKLMTTFGYPDAPLEMSSEYVIEDEQVSGLEKHQKCKGKKRLLGALLRAGFKDLSKHSCDSLPTFSDITNTYGSEPHVIGMESCRAYRETLGVDMISNVRIGGLNQHHHSSLIQLFIDNLHVQHASSLNMANLSNGLESSFESEMSWAQRLNSSSSSVPIFPILVTMDPFRFMNNKCNHPADAKWQRGWRGRCPNLVPTAFEREIDPDAFSDIDTFAVTTHERMYESLADVWVSWNQNVLHISRPRLILRFEDFLFHPAKLAEHLSQCLGTKMNRNFNMVDIGALEEYGMERLKGLTIEDRVYAQKALPTELLNSLRYEGVPADETAGGLDEQFSGLEAKSRVCNGKKKLLGILARAGKTKMSTRDCYALPRWSSFTELYGDDPVVLGLERCEQYRNVQTRNGVNSRPILVESLPHSGAPALVEAIRLNLGNATVQAGTAVEGQRFPRHGNFGNSSSLPFLPLVVVRDPFRWMQLMCHLPLNANWTRGEKGRCPNFVPSAAERRNPRYSNVTTFHVEVTHDDVYKERYASLVDLWTSYYRSYIAADFPRLVIRFEDLMFHAERVMEQVSQCIGSPMTKPYEYSHPDRSLLDTGRYGRMLELYASEAGRYSHLTVEDLMYQKYALSPGLMDLLHYKRMPNPKGGGFPKMNDMTFDFRDLLNTED